MRSRKTGGMGGGRAGRRVSALAPAAQAQDFFSQLFGGERARPRAAALYLDAVPAVMTALWPRSGARCGRAISRVAAVAGALRAGPATGVISRSPRPTRQAGRPPATASARRARPRCFTAAVSTTRRRQRQVLFGAAERLPLSQRNRQRLHLQRQGIKWGWRRSRSRTTRRCARATSSPARMACWLVGNAAPTRRGAELDFFARLWSKVRARNTGACRWWRGSN